MKYTIYTEEGNLLFSTNNLADAESVVWAFGGKVTDKNGRVIIELTD